ncbi:MAG: glycosyltransferase family 8 protein [Planctomycetota bacterium]
MQEELDASTITLVMAADDGFALPLAVTVRSLLETVDSDRRIQLYVIDGGIRPDTKSRLEASWSGFAFEATFIRPNLRLLHRVSASGHVSLSTYFRLLIPELLPPEIEEVIYLDADLLIRRDIGNLWDKAIGDSWCLAAQDCAAPFINASSVFADEKRTRLLAANTPIPNYRELGITSTLPYYNCGVLRINLSRWREQNLTARLLECLHENKDSVLWWDQYALNVVLVGHWGQLDLRWNQGSHVFRYKDWQSSPFQQEEFENLRTDPWIVHFSSPVKPWHALCRHPFRSEFLDTLDRTAWKGTRPGNREYATRVTSACWNTMLGFCKRPVAAYIRRRRN